MGQERKEKLLRSYLKMKNDIRRRLIYIASPYRGCTKTNLEIASAYCRLVLTNGDIPICPHLFYSTVLDDNISEEREIGMNMGIQLLRQCAALYVFGEPSEGMRAEIAEATALRIPIEYFTSNTIRLEHLNTVAMIFKLKNNLTI